MRVYIDSARDSVTVSHGDDSVTLVHFHTVASALDYGARTLHTHALARYHETRLALRNAVRTSYPYQSDGTLECASEFRAARRQLDACEYLRAPTLTIGALRDGEPGIWSWE